MKYPKLILAGALAIIVSAIPTQAAVYGTLRQDVSFNTEDGKTISRLSGEAITILEEQEDEYLIKVSEDLTELVNKNFVKLSGVISTTKRDTKVREAADPNSSLIASLEQDELVMVLDRKDNYYKIKVNETVGYIYKTEIETEHLTQFEKSSSEKLGEEIVAYAKNYLGGRYVYGGNNLNTGVDCSGFVQQIMKNFDIKMARSSRSQYASNGVSVSREELKPGDLVYYGNGGRINHVAIYAGNGQIIHASDTRTGITMGSLYYGKAIIGIKRVV